jgi:hypothetical protein
MAADSHSAKGKAVKDMDRVWVRIKQKAQELAEERRSLSPHHAKEIVWQIFHAEKAERPPGDALDFLASELQELIAKFAQQREST